MTTNCEIVIFLPYIQNSINWWKKVVQQVLSYRYKEEASIFSLIIDSVIKKFFNAMTIYKKKSSILKVDSSTFKAA